MSRLKFVSVAEETNLGLVEQLRRQVFSWRDSFHIQHSNRLTIRKGWSLAVSLWVRCKFTETLLCWSDNLRQQVKTFEPRHDKTIQMSVRPPKTQISLGIRPVWSESSLCALWVANDPSFFLRTAKAVIRLGGCPGWSESSLGVHSFCWVCHVAAHII